MQRSWFIIVNADIILYLSFSIIIILEHSRILCDSKSADSKYDEAEEEIASSRIFVMEELISYCESNKFQEALSDFRFTHVPKFKALAESKLPEDEVQSLEFTEIFNEYQGLIDRLISDFAESHGAKTKSLLKECRDSIEGNFTPIFEEHKNKWFVDLMFSWMEYPYFLNEMINEARNAKSRRK